MTYSTDRTSGKPQPSGIEKMGIDDLLDLIEITLELAMRLGHAETASHLYRASETLCPENEDEPLLRG